MTGKPYSYSKKVVQKLSLMPSWPPKVGGGGNSGDKAGRWILYQANKLSVEAKTTKQCHITRALSVSHFCCALGCKSGHG